jgi:DNA (cytosine-5)-methyltransferase 1
MVSSVGANVRSTTAAVIDLFAGAGGLGLGSIEAGGDLRLSVEIDPTACDTLRANAKASGRIWETDLTRLTGSGLRKAAGLSLHEPLVVVGGPPCQPFSKAAYWTEPGQDAAYRRARASGVEGGVRPAAPTVARPDDRRSLVEHFSRLVIESKADGFIFENVVAITHPRNRPILDRLLSDLGSAGFRISVLKANAVAFGIAQRRERVFVMGSRARTPAAPVATHLTSSDPTPTTAHLQSMPTAGAACAPFRGQRFSEPAENITGRWADHLRTVPPGWNYKAHTAWGGHPTPTFITETRFWNFLLKLDPNLPSWTIAANPGPWTGPFHWQSRRLRIVELAALQGFPASYAFTGTRREQVRQIGNAVPPLFAQAMVRSVLETLRGTSRRTQRRVS